MSLQVKGRLHTKFPTQQIKDTFKKREFVIEISEDSANGTVYTNYASFQLVNDSCSIIDQFQEGEMLNVSFGIRGNRWERDGQVKYITNLNAWRVEKVGTEQPQQHNVQSYTPQPMLANNFTQPSTGSADDLPF